MFWALYAHFDLRQCTWMGYQQSIVPTRDVIYFQYIKSNFEFFDTESNLLILVLSFYNSNIFLQYWNAFIISEYLQYWYIWRMWNSTWFGFLPKYWRGVRNSLLWNHWYLRDFHLHPKLFFDLSRLHVYKMHSLWFTFYLNYNVIWSLWDGPKQVMSYKKKLKNVW